MAEELTPWFPPGVKPARSGYYDTQMCAFDGTPIRPELRLYWNANRELFMASPSSRNHYCFDQLRIWRGLAKEPK